jgi:addiction module HigA family antidote
MIRRKESRRGLRIPLRKACRHVRARDFRERFGTCSPHPGRILHQDFLLRLEISEYRLAHCTGMGAGRVNEIILGKRAVTVDSALRLGDFLGTGPLFWLALQARHDVARQRLQESLGMKPARKIPSARAFA